MSKRFTLDYFNGHFNRCVTINRWLTISMAIISSGSVATWAIWKQLPVLWMALVMGSQIVSVIKDYLPYRKRINELSDLKCQLTFIYTEIEEKWLQVSDGTFNEHEINDLIYQFNRQWNEIDAKYFINDFLPYSKRIADQAQQITNAYVRQTIIGG